MPEIIIPGGTRTAREHGGSVGYSFRIARVRNSSGHLPPFRCESMTKGLFYLCGRCFGMLGDGPRTSGEEMWTAGTDRAGNFITDPVTQRPVVPREVRCHQCGGRAWPAD